MDAGFSTAIHMPDFSPPNVIRLLCWPPLSGAAAAAVAADAGFVLMAVDSAAAARAELATGRVELALVEARWLAEPTLLADWSARIPVVLWQSGEAAEAVDDAAALNALAHGAQDVLTPDDWLSPRTVHRRLRSATVRHRLAREARHAYATDLATGLPHQQQLLEHMSHLLALREREPAPMALLVLRVEGLLTTEARLGATAAASLRRKLAVRLRSGLRASDVVASLGADSFAVLLAWIDAVADVDGVAAKLVQAVQRPFSIQGQPVALALSVGVARYPDDAKDGDALLHMAQTQAANLPGLGRAGFANHLERGPAEAANDDEA